MILPGPDSVNSSIEPYSLSNVRNEARKRWMLADMVILDPHFKTLFSGMKLNHPDNVATLTVIYFLARRLLYAIAIVGLADMGIVGASLLQMASLG